jgi:intraflagellar transport protein 81
MLYSQISFETFLFFFAYRNTFRQNLVSGDKSVVFPILQWLLEKVPEHKERAYLGRYLSKIDIPTEFLSDSEIAEQHERVKSPNFF